MELRDSYLRCPRDGKPLAIFALEEEGQRLVPHRCLSCGWSEMAPGERPQRTDSPFLHELREKLWTEVSP